MLVFRLRAELVTYLTHRHSEVQALEAFSTALGIKFGLSIYGPILVMQLSGILSLSNLNKLSKNLPGSESKAATTL